MIYCNLVFRIFLHSFEDFQDMKLVVPEAFQEKSEFTLSKQAENAHDISYKRCLFADLQALNVLFVLHQREKRPEWREITQLLHGEGLHEQSQQYFYDVNDDRRLVILHLVYVYDCQDLCQKRRQSWEKLHD